MSAATERCIAITDAGVRCLSYAQTGSVHCPAHDTQPSHRSTQARGEAATPHRSNRPVTPEMQLLAQEVDAFVREMRARRLRLDAPELSPTQLAHLLNRTIGKRLPAGPAALLEDVERNLADASFADFADPDVLRGMALLTYYSLQAQAEPYRDPLAQRLQSVPGYSFLTQLRHNLGDATIQDFTQPGAWSIVWETAATSARLKLIELLHDYDEKHDSAAAPPLS